MYIRKRNASFIIYMKSGLPHLVRTNASWDKTLIKSAYSYLKDCVGRGFILNWGAIINGVFWGYTDDFNLILTSKETTNMVSIRQSVVELFKLKWDPLYTCSTSHEIANKQNYLLFSWNNNIVDGTHENYFNWYVFCLLSYYLQRYFIIL